MLNKDKYITACKKLAESSSGFDMSGYLYLYTIFDQRRVDIIDKVEYGVHDRLHIYPLCEIFYFLRRRHQIEGSSRDQRHLVSLPKDTAKLG